MAPRTGLVGRDLQACLRCLWRQGAVVAGDIPLSIRHAAGWSGTDSLTVRWQCFDQTSLAGLFLEEIQRRDSALADQES